MSKAQQQAPQIWTEVLFRFYLICVCIGNCRVKLHMIMKSSEWAVVWDQSRYCNSNDFHFCSLYCYEFNYNSFIVSFFNKTLWAEHVELNNDWYHLWKEQKLPNHSWFIHGRERLSGETFYYEANGIKVRRW